jgi:2-amino-4-hydroxy-6-hydroxymethyldihydropteridine diphosphokinase
VERALGRVRTVPNAPRTIDVDVLLHGDAVIETRAARVLASPRSGRQHVAQCESASPGYAT